MKNNFLIFFLITILIQSPSIANQFIFKTSEIELTNNGDLIYAKNGKATSSDGNLEIEAKNFEYIKNDNTLKALNGIAYFKLENIKIEFDEILTNQSTLITKAINNIKIVNTNKQITIETDSVTFDKKKIFWSQTHLL